MDTKPSSSSNISHDGPKTLFQLANEKIMSMSHHRMYDSKQFTNDSDYYPAFNKIIDGYCSVLYCKVYGECLKAKKQIINELPLPQCMLDAIWLRLYLWEYKFDYDVDHRYESEPEDAVSFTVPSRRETI